MKRILAVALPLTILLCALLSDWECALAAGKIIPVKVFVECYGGDSIGPRVCSALKEKIRASSGFELVETQSAGDFGVHIESQDVAGSGALSAIAYTFTVSNGTSETYLTSFVSTCGFHRINDVTDGLFGDINERSEFLRR